MTLAELSRRMSATEFDLWVAYAMKQQYECPSCGHEPNEMMEFTNTKQHCPICKTDYHRTERVREFDVVEATD